MSADEPGKPDLDNTSDEIYNSSDAANASARKGQPWSEEEHMAFLAGLASLGKGNWRSISKQFVPTRTPTQVASHAQKHFMRVAGATKRKSRFTALEVEVTPPGKVPRASHNSGHAAQESQQVEQQAAANPVMAPSQAFQQQMAAFPPMAFPFMHPMMFGFPGPFFPPFMCPPPAFAAAMQSAMNKQGPMSPMMMPPMFPMAAMAAMTPFFMAQQMAAAAQQAAVAAHAAAAQAATSGGATTAGTGPAATTDTANSDEVLPRTHSVPGSPGVCKPEAQHVRPTSTSGTAMCTTGVAAVPAAGSAAAAADGPSEAGEVVSAKKRRVSGGGGECTLEQPPRQSSSRAADVPMAFHASSHSAFRPPQVPQEIKAES